ncbi:hypothetical protein JTE90_003386 [Oedothorax gibbosus]|uniref:Uncharacterized protein n=1 Tax=Oedothorax gibbosus TaxID=931172 RepID=A0AAV6TXQ3_9ARAC|nr:hypothetical protein JTE90_003386 [Oedothorax gibbosus]
MVDQGICRISKSPWSTPLHIVSKASGDIRPVGDYRRLNSVTIPDRYQIPHIQDFSNALHGKCIFSKIYIVRAYFHIPIHPEHIPNPANSSTCASPTAHDPTTPSDNGPDLRTPAELSNSGQEIPPKLQGRQTYDVLAKELYGIFVEYEIQNKVSVATTDNGKNFCKAFRFEKAFQNEDLIMAAILHPRFKLDWLPEDRKDEGKRKLASLLSSHNRFSPEQEENDEGDFLFSKKEVTSTEDEAHRYLMCKDSCFSILHGFSTLTMYKNAKKEDILKCAAELEVEIPENPTILNLRKLIEETEIYKKDPGFVGDMIASLLRNVRKKLLMIISSR